MSVETFVAGMWATALSGSAAILLVLALRAPLRRAFGAGVAYAVWGVVPLAMLAVLLPGDVRRALPAALAMPQVWVGLPQESAGAAGAMTLASSHAALWMAALWLLGAAAMAAALWRQQQRYRHSLGQLSPGTDGVLYAQHAVHGPLVLGAWRPRVEVDAPGAADGLLDRDEQRMRARGSGGQAPARSEEEGGKDRRGDEQQRDRSCQL
jgi:beta-lactamase regulating signal transducer with metallopeptidase domain